MKRFIKSYEYRGTFPAPILVKDFQDKIDNTNLDGIKYGPSIDRSFDFEKSYDNAEWMLQQAEVENEK